jgi:hypothetical protein
MLTALFFQERSGAYATMLRSMGMAMMKAMPHMMNPEIRQALIAQTQAMGRAGK